MGSESESDWDSMSEAPAKAIWNAQNVPENPPENLRTVPENLRNGQVPNGTAAKPQNGAAVLRDSGSVNKGRFTNIYSCIHMYVYY